LFDVVDCLRIDTIVGSSMSTAQRSYAVARSLWTVCEGDDAEILLFNRLEWTLTGFGQLFTIAILATHFSPVMVTKPSKTLANNGKSVIQVWGSRRPTGWTKNRPPMVGTIRGRNYTHFKSSTKRYTFQFSRRFDVLLAPSQ
jgi:hypothetical protein